MMAAKVFSKFSTFLKILSEKHHELRKNLYRDIQSSVFTNEPALACSTGTDRYWKFPFEALGAHWIAEKTDPRRRIIIPWSLRNQNLLENSSHRSLQKVKGWWRVLMIFSANLGQWDGLCQGRLPSLSSNSPLLAAWDEFEFACIQPKSKFVWIRRHRRVSRADAIPCSLL